jgi:hypothetical protein
MHIILMKIVYLEVPVKENVFNIKFIWTRGDLTQESKNKYSLTKSKNHTTVNENFVKLSEFYRNSGTG